MPSTRPAASTSGPPEKPSYTAEVEADELVDLAAVPGAPARAHGRDDAEGRR
jgi:hypothetical protein